MPDIYTNYYESSHLFHGNMSIIMGTRLDVVLLGLERDAAEAVWQLLTAETLRLDRMLNRFDAESELYKVNQLAMQAPVFIQEELWHILSDCKRYHTLTEGYFDVTMKDYSRIVLDGSACSVFFDRKDLYLDLGGYAKGYALNKMKDILEQEGVTQALINFGNSSVLGVGHHPYGDYWPVGVEDPYHPGTTLGEVQLNDTAMSTSGNMPSHPQHIINPKTGEYVTGRKLAVIVTPDAVDAEVLSTVLMTAPAEQAERIRQWFNISYCRVFVLPE